MQNYAIWHSVKSVNGSQHDWVRSNKKIELYCNKDDADYVANAMNEYYENVSSRAINTYEVRLIDDKDCIDVNDVVIVSFDKPVIKVKEKQMR